MYPQNSKRERRASQIAKTLNYQPGGWWHEGVRVFRPLNATEGNEEYIRHIYSSVQPESLLGTLAVTLIKGGEIHYRRSKLVGNLGAMSIYSLIGKLDHFVQTSLPQRLEVDVDRIEIYSGSTRQYTVAYKLEESQLVPDRQSLITEIDGFNGQKTHWKRYEPHLSLLRVGTRREAESYASHLEVPQTITLGPAIVEDRSTRKFKDKSIL